MTNLHAFLSKFVFNQALCGSIGIERERFLVDVYGNIVPRAKEFLDAIKDPAWTYELSACQAEDRTKPQKKLADVWRELSANDQNAKIILRLMNAKLVALEVAPEHMPLDIYPDPRYLDITAKITKERLRAACRVAGVHVHIGMRDLSHAIRAFNKLRKYLRLLCSLGDGSSGERLRLYKIMAAQWNPPEITSQEHFLQLAINQGFAENPRNCYWLMRISIHGTIELRMFGSSGIPTVMRNAFLSRLLLKISGEQ